MANLQKKEVRLPEGETPLKNKDLSVVLEGTERSSMTTEHTEDTSEGEDAGLNERRGRDRRPRFCSTSKLEGLQGKESPRSPGSMTGTPRSLSRMKSRSVARQPKGGFFVGNTSGHGHRHTSTTVMLGILNALERSFVRVGFFMPVGYDGTGLRNPQLDLMNSVLKLSSTCKGECQVGIGEEDALKMMADDKQEDLLDRIYSKFRQFSDMVDAVVVEGSPFGVEFDAKVAAMLNIPVIMVTSGVQGMKALEFIEDVTNAYQVYKDENCLVASMIVNRVPKRKIKKVCSHFKRSFPDLFAGAIPEDHILSSIRLDEIKVQLTATQLMGSSDALTDKDVSTILVAGSNVDELLPKLEQCVDERPLIVATASRADVLLSVLAMHSSGALPVAGMLLTEAKAGGNCATESAVVAAVVRGIYGPRAVLHPLPPPDATDMSSSLNLLPTMFKPGAANQPAGKAAKKPAGAPGGAPQSKFSRAAGSLDIDTATFGSGSSLSAAARSPSGKWGAPVPAADTSQDRIVRWMGSGNMRKFENVSRRGSLASKVPSCDGSTAGSLLDLAAVDTGSNILPILAVHWETYETVVRLSNLKSELLPTSVKKIDRSRQLFDTHVDHNKAMAVLREANDKLMLADTITPKMFQYQMKSMCLDSPRRIVLPEGNDKRVLQAAAEVAAAGLAHVMVLGKIDSIMTNANMMGLDMSDVEILDPECSPKLLEEYSLGLYEARKHKGLTLDRARDALLDVNMFATMMVKCGDADGMVSGACHTTAATVRPGMQVLRETSSSLVSSVFFMCLPDKVLIYGDCAVNVDPTAEQLAEIAITSAETALAFNIEPLIAMLSYSTLGSGAGPQVEKVLKATELVKAKRPDLCVEGPIQYDAAINPDIAAVKVKTESEVAGKATVFVFPDLNTGNNTYKAVQQASGAVAMGPIMQGLMKPVNDLSRGCTVQDIIDTICVTSVQALGPEAELDMSSSGGSSVFSVPAAPLPPMPIAAAAPPKRQSPKPPKVPVAPADVAVKGPPAQPPARPAAAASPFVRRPGSPDDGLPVSTDAPNPDTPPRAEGAKGALRKSLEGATDASGKSPLACGLKDAKEQKKSVHVCLF